MSMVLYVFNYVFVTLFNVGFFYLLNLNLLDMNFDFIFGSKLSSSILSILGCVDLFNFDL